MHSDKEKSIEKLERLVFYFSLCSPLFFRHFVRPILYILYEKDPERVHEESLRYANIYDDVIKSFVEKHKKIFDLHRIKIGKKGKGFIPIGTAAGIDKNGDAMIPFSRIFGYQTIGTIIVNQNDGNEKPRLVVDNKNKDAYNAMSFPSNGLEHCLNNLKRFRELMGYDHIIIANICGLPLLTETIVEDSMQGVDYLTEKLNPYVDGFEWNPSSPNTEVLSLLRRPDIFKEHAKIIRKYASEEEKLLLVKMRAYEEKDKDKEFSLFEAFIGGGGDGGTFVNSLEVSGEKVPLKGWKHKVAGKSGRSLKLYRIRAVKDFRKAFPKAFISATGGIFDWRDAYETLEIGASTIQGFIPNAFYGPGLPIKMMKGINKKVKKSHRSGLYDIMISNRNQSISPPFSKNL